ncbi:response regulator transcription factor [Aliiroseovarius sp. PrR006]|uniref:response regulator transcription factor n=1 Tax=Aliiroseovarius sp. PrR006 TaxID=2706883 RepID=UPI0013D6F8A2|nr:response regulator transcription factor [Aliiroseovarius sp. PrR006]NDW53155.1 response regulator transcription factor [Aliiroseovarius sp. PrR006]
MKLLIASDDATLRRTVLAAAESCGIPSPFEADSMQRALDTLGKAPGYDCAVIDYRLPDLGGLKAIEKLCRRDKRLAVALLLPKKEVDLLRQALRTGACVGAPVEISETALASILTLISEDLGLMAYPISHRPNIDQHGTRLSRREMQILDSLCAGRQNKEIAHIFGIQEVTVKMHMRSIITKLGAKNRTHAAMIALRNGIV